MAGNTVDSNVPYGDFTGRTAARSAVSSVRWGRGASSASVQPSSKASRESRLKRCSSAQTAPPEFTRCIDDLQGAARAAGVSESAYRRFTQDLQPDMSVIEKLDYQPEFRMPIWDYLSGLVDEDGNALNAVIYDNADKDALTLAGAEGTRIGNLADGVVATTSTDAINGRQLYAGLQDKDAAGVVQALKVAKDTVAYLPLHLWDYIRPDPVFAPPVAATVRVVVQLSFIWAGLTLWRRQRS